MKTVFLLFGLILSSNYAICQICNPRVKQSDVSQCKILHIGLTDSATHIFFKYTNNNLSEWICAGEDFFIKDLNTGKKYRLTSSLNIPLCPDVHIFAGKQNIHYFSLSFSPLPKDVTVIDIIEKEGSKGFNFYGVELKPVFPIVPMDYNSLLEETPVREYGFAMKNGDYVQHYFHKDVRLSGTLNYQKQYGKYYVLSLLIENYSDKRIDFYPEKIESYIITNKDTFEIGTWTYAEYMRRVNRRQKWNSAFAAMGEYYMASDAGNSTSTTKTKSYANIDGLPYHYKTSYSTTTSYDGAAKYYAMQNAINNANNFESQQYHIKQSINLGYLKSNSILKNQQVTGYINIDYENGDFLLVKVPINKSKYYFLWKLN